MVKLAAAVPVITLDGPSGVGKGTVCVRLAQALDWHILDSGSLYRLVALLTDDIDVKNIKQLVEIAKNLDVEYVPDNGHIQVLLQQQDVTQAIRSEAVGDKASRVAVLPEVREALLGRQKAFAQPPGLVADGRDMGTVVFPDASLKIYFTASPKERAKRRYKQLKEKGIDANLPSLVEELRKRDERDSSRSTAPLKAAADAIVIDTTHMNVEEVIREVMQLVSQRLKL